MLIKEQTVLLGLFLRRDAVAKCSVLPNTHRRRRRDETVESSRPVGGVNTPVGNRLQFPVLTSDDILTLLVKKL